MNKMPQPRSDLTKRENYALYLVDHVGFSIQEAAQRTAVSEFWLNLKFPEERKVTASNKYKLETIEKLK